MSLPQTSYAPEPGVIDKRRVTMKNVVPAGFDDDGKPVVHVHVAVDYVRPDILDAYVAKAREGWQHVEVSAEPDAGPLGYDGPTHVPDTLDHPLAGQTFEGVVPETPLEGEATAVAGPDLTTPEV